MNKQVSDDERIVFKQIEEKVRVLHAKVESKENESDYSNDSEDMANEMAWETWEQKGRVYNGTLWFSWTCLEKWNTIEIN